jgi:hypothetical protein
MDSRKDNMRVFELSSPIDRIAFPPRVRQLRRDPV